MDIVKSAEIKSVKVARKIIDAQTERIWALENCLADLSRACEIAQYSQQYHLTESFRQAADDMLADRLTVSEPEDQSMKINIITGELDSELNRQITERAKIAAGIE